MWRDSKTSSAAWIGCDSDPVTQLPPEFRNSQAGLRRGQWLEVQEVWRIGGAQAMTPRVGRETSPVHWAVMAEFRRPVFEVSEHRLQPYRRQFPLAGAQVDVQFLPTALNVQMRFE